MQNFETNSPAQIFTTETRRDRDCTEEKISFFAAFRGWNLFFLLSQKKEILPSVQPHLSLCLCGEEMEISRS
jgi:hypothetical protein